VIKKAMILLNRSKCSVIVNYQLSTDNIYLTNLIVIIISKI